MSHKTSKHRKDDGSRREEGESWPVDPDELPGPETSEPTADSEGDEPPSDAQPLAAELTAARSEAAENHDRWIRAVAELENFRRRATRDRDEAETRARAEVLLDVITVLDDVDRALASMSEAASAEDAVIAGIRLIRARLEEVLRRHGVTEIDAVGQSFDPHVHDAVLQVPAGDVPDGHVAQVLQRGYWLGERVLRPARVAVAHMQQHA